MSMQTTATLGRKAAQTPLLRRATLVRVVKNVATVAASASAMLGAGAAIAEALPETIVALLAPAIVISIGYLTILAGKEVQR